MWLNTIYQNEAFLNQVALVFALVLSRVSGMVMTAPVFGSNGTPLHVRALFAVAISVIIIPLELKSIFTLSNPTTLINFAILIGCELLIGIILGMGVMLIFTGMQVAGQIIGQLGGMALADVFSPGFDANVPILSQLLFYVTTAVFVIIGGHRQLIEALLDTFTALPIGDGKLPATMADTMVTLLSQSFVLGVRAAAPAMTALLLSTLVMGLITRTLPQMNIMAFGFSLNAMITFGSVMLSLGVVSWIFQEHVEIAMELLKETLTKKSVIPTVP